ncbi:substrate-binding domain-containing protein [Conexibacter woesei]|uniref:ABC-type sugar transport system periplasmic component-like protein n=1 Tax=Conexibacter woesei (strain DSM 14684 / CCUG 47730 / CIP 108061 / JCM 11494 / NBRC 100937 / ID131577) TaxID=469383 RepID=D3F9V0_CONWI|nr:substrate-binding domain-containing protein [Conexibacter woesei]ADB51162.1 ABC-type sugar transport system periplasmic component-like protein [Conexibacter woesei DSM 14684]
MKLLHRRALPAAVLACLTAVTFAACGSSDSDSTATSASTGDGGGEKVKMVISNNFLGNDFRPQMLKLAELTARQPPFADSVELEVVNAENTTQAQVASINNIIQGRPDVLLVDAGSPTALNPALKRACAAGIRVISFDQVVTEPCAWKVAQSHADGQLLVGQWMAQTLGNRGKILLDRGLPGAPVSREIEDAFLEGLDVGGGGVEIAGEFDGKYAPGPEQQGISQLLVGNRDAAGVMTQGYCNPAFKAFRQAGISTVPATTCYGYNGELVGCMKERAPCAVLAGPPTVVQIAMKLGLDAAQGRDTPPTSEQVPVPVTLFVTNADEFRPKENPGEIAIEQIELGRNAYEDLPPGLALPFSLQEYDITAEQAAG